MPLGNKIYEVTYRKKGKKKPILKTTIIGFNRKQVLRDIYARGFIPVKVEKESWAYATSKKKMKM